MHTHDHKLEIRDFYRRVAESGGAVGCCGASCSHANPNEWGYTDADAAAAPAQANTNLGCGNPVALATLREGEAVLDLGSGGGFDCFLAADRVGPRGTVIGVDMTPEMVTKAREIQNQAGIENVSFRLGEIEHLPVPDRTIDVVLSNCVVNLAIDKRAVFEETRRVLKPGGRLAVMDMVSIAPLPTALADHAHAWPSCMAGAVTPGEIESMLWALGFERVRVAVQAERDACVRSWSPDVDLSPYVASASIEAVRPFTTGCC